MEKMAYVGKIVEISPIPEANRIVSAVAVCGPGGKWHGVVQKDQFRPGDLCEMFLQDCIVPKEDPRFAFMEKNHWRIKISRFKGALSECLIMPLTVTGNVGQDISDILKVDKYIKPLPANMSGDAKGGFPSCIPRTDEINFQAAPEMVEALKNKLFYVSVKADGASGTAYYNTDDKDVVCCSRNLALKRTERSALYQLADRYHFAEILKDTTLALQWETVGPGIQKNPMRLEQLDMRLFDVYDWNTREYWSPEEMITLAAKWLIPTVQLVEMGTRPFTLSDAEMIALSEAQVYPNNKPAEGIVIRGIDRVNRHSRISFKVINPKYES